LQKDNEDFKERTWCQGREIDGEQGEECVRTRCVASFYVNSFHGLTRFLFEARDLIVKVVGALNAYGMKHLVDEQVSDIMIDIIKSYSILFG
jgi:hypothetical protein